MQEKIKGSIKYGLLVLAFASAFMMLFSFVESYLSMSGLPDEKVLELATIVAYGSVPLLSISLLCIIGYLVIHTQKSKGCA